MGREQRSSEGGMGRGDNLWLFVLYNLLAVLLFFGIGSCFGIFDNSNALSNLSVMDFLVLYLKILLANAISGVLGWGLAYMLMKWYKKYVLNGKTIKQFGDLSRGVNKFPLFSLAFFLAILLSSMCFAIGLFSILEAFLFSKSSIVTGIFLLLVMKLVIFIVIRIIIESKF